MTSPHGEAKPAPTGYDPVQVAADARRSDPGLPPETAELLAEAAGRALAEDPDADAPSLARTLLSDHPEAGATACNMVATAAVGVPGPASA